MKTLEQLQGEVKPLIPIPKNDFVLLSDNDPANKATILKTFGPSTQDNSRQKCQNINFISLKETIKVAQSKDTEVSLAIARPISVDNMPKKRMKTKTKIRVGVAHGMMVRSAGC